MFLCSTAGTGAEITISRNGKTFASGDSVTVAFTDMSGNDAQISILCDKIIPKDNLLRRINENIDSGFILDKLKAKYCPDNRRTAELPVRLFKYLLLKCINQLSEVDVVEHSGYNMSYKYLPG